MAGRRAGSAMHLRCGPLPCIPRLPPEHPLALRASGASAHLVPRPLPLPCAPPGAGDETLRFWNVFPGPKAQGSGSDSGMGSMMRTLIR